MAMSRYHGPHVLGWCADFEVQWGISSSELIDVEFRRSWHALVNDGFQPEMQASGSISSVDIDSEPCTPGLEDLDETCPGSNMHLAVIHSSHNDSPSGSCQLYASEDEVIDEGLLKLDFKKDSNELRTPDLIDPVLPPLDSCAIPLSITDVSGTEYLRCI
jgi:hypothetical protein